MYLMRLKYICPKCSFETLYGPHDPFDAPVLSEGPICPRCYANFLREHCGVMVNQGPKGNYYKEPEKLPGTTIQNTRL